jgi:hypothetical protein
MSSTKSTKLKYRPVLTAEQILHIITLATSELPISTESMSVLQSLSPYSAKIQVAAIKPAYDPVDPLEAQRRMLASLGGSLNLEHELADVPEYVTALTTKEERWAAAYAKLKIIPSVALSMQEMADAMEHMYLNDLMTPEQAREFEGEQD